MSQFCKMRVKAQMLGWLDNKKNTINPPSDDKPLSDFDIELPVASTVGGGLVTGILIIGQTSTGLHRSCAALAYFSGTFELIVEKVWFCFVLFSLDQYMTVSLVVVSCWIGSLNKQTK